MNSMIINRLNDVHNFTTEYQEEIPVRNFDEINLKGLRNIRELTPSRVDQIIDNYWSPNGFIAWDFTENKTLRMILFKGRAAVVSEFVEDGKTVKDLILETMSLANLEKRTVIFTNCA